MLKITKLSELLVFKKIKNNSYIIKFSINNNNKEFIKKLRKLKS